MAEHSRDEFQAVESVEARRLKLSNYIFNPAVLRRRVNTALMGLQDALFIWSRAVGKPFFLSAALIDQSKLDNCRVFNHRTTLLESLPASDRTMEIGVLQGAFSRKIIDSLHPRHHTMIDTNVDQIDKTLFEGLNVELSVLNGKSGAILPTLPDSGFDYVYIDGAHDEESVAGDLNEAARLVRDGGVIMLNDYCNWSPNQAVPYGVQRATNDFLNDRSFEMIGIAIDGSGAYDVALRRTG